MPDTVREITNNISKQNILYNKDVWHKKHWDKTVTILLNPDLGQASINMLGLKYKLAEISALRAPYKH